jgi:hypothetical protein
LKAEARHRHAVPVWERQRHTGWGLPVNGADFVLQERFHCFAPITQREAS